MYDGRLEHFMLHEGSLGGQKPFENPWDKQHMATRGNMATQIGDRMRTLRMWFSQLQTSQETDNFSLEDPTTDPHELEARL